eukprot:GILK01003089.1.p1 GENE.GILK01003089.1~~GILK01003089.1.p1  ORF type:complete len:293 (-),score=56.33 GILK01003089.1:183-1019(-)
MEDWSTELSHQIEASLLKRTRARRKKVEEADNATKERFDNLEDWLESAFTGSTNIRGPREDTATLNKSDTYDEEEEDDDADLEDQFWLSKKGLKFFAAGDFASRLVFASFLFPKFEGDTHYTRYIGTFKDVLRVAGGRVKPRTRHKLTFGLGTLWFSADQDGHMFAVLSSNEYPQAFAFRFLWETIPLFDTVNIASAVREVSHEVAQEDYFKADAFGLRPLIMDAYKTYVREGDGNAFDTKDLDFERDFEYEEELEEAGHELAQDEPVEPSTYDDHDV